MMQAARIMIRLVAQCEAKIDGANLWRLFESVLSAIAKERYDKYTSVCSLKQLEPHRDGLDGDKRSTSREDKWSFQSLIGLLGLLACLALPI